MFLNLFKKYNYLYLYIFKKRFELKYKFNNLKLACLTMEIFDLDEFQPIKKIVEDSRETIRNVINKHFTETLHDEKRKIEEMRFFIRVLKFLTKKWNIEILYELEIHNGLTFNKIMRHMEKISSRTLSDCLKQLQSINLITRTIQDTRPPSVLYELSDKGKGFIELSMIMIFYLANNSDK